MARKRPTVGVVMGSDSDLETMKRCLKQLDEFGIVYEVRIISAHRTPDTAHEYAATAIQRGLKVIIAAAGMSAALGGVLAANTTLPIVGVPMASGPLVGVDAALSTMQMPPGVPVACMSIGGAGATNGAIYAAQILAVSDKKLAGKLSRFKKSQARKVARKDAELRKSL
ncbi:MAG: 5-(carboxyamino)imidazole ribonucleotide mutase [Phycisphaerae bacterium]|jgi:phosphoribosylaminoimidazole carboxylase PurE protein|nr:5-(carboxyamino)imidazole ribonucleotide mutase [Phycisphaerae bacterium]